VAPEWRRCTWSIKDQKRIGLVNSSGASIHHVVNGALNCPVAFIFGEHPVYMVNRWFDVRAANAPQIVPA